MNGIELLVRDYKRAHAITNSKRWPQIVKARFIEPGLVNYDDLGLGMVLVRRPFIDKIRQSFVGKPVIDEQHKDAKPENFKDIADGAVIRVWNDPADGWDWCEFLVWDDEAYRHCKDPQYFVSCAYDPTQMDRNGGKHNNVEYDGEFLDGSYTHLAIVKDPRYEGARIVWNALGAKAMNIFKLFKKSEEVADVNGAETFLEVDGEKISIENAVKLIKAENAKASNGAMKDDDVIEIDGKKMSGKDIKNAVRNARKAMNKGEDGEKAGDQEEDIEKEKEEGKKRDKGEAKNDISDKAQDEDTARRDKIDARNSLGDEPEEKGKHIEEFKKAAEMRNNQPGMPTISTQVDRIKLGSERYGKKNQEVA